jgi:hypothetical protein
VEESRGTDVMVYSVIAFDALKTRERRESVKEWLSAIDVGNYIVHLYNGTAPKTEEPIHTLHSAKDIAFMNR